MQMYCTGAHASLERMKSALIRSIPFWLLLALSVGLAAAGTFLISQHLGTMTKTLGDGSATGLEVYAGQSWIVVGAALLGAGALGVLVTLALAAATALVPTAVGTAETPAAPAAIGSPAIEFGEPALPDRTVADLGDSETSGDVSDSQTGDVTDADETEAGETAAVAGR